MKKCICILTVLSAMTAGAFTTNVWTRAADNNWATAGNWDTVPANWTDYSANLVFGVGNGANYWTYNNVSNTKLASMTFAADSPSNYSINNNQIQFTTGNADGDLIVNNMSSIAKFENSLMFNYGTSADRYIRANSGGIWLGNTTYYTSTLGGYLHFYAADGANILFKSASTLNLVSSGNQYNLYFEGDGTGGTIDLNSSLSYNAANSDPGLNLNAKDAITVNLSMAAGEVEDLILEGATINWGDNNMVAGDILLGEGVNELDFGDFDDELGTLGIGANSDNMMDFSGADSDIVFADSSGENWLDELIITGFDSETDSLRFGTDAGGLTSAQLALVTINGSTGAGLDSDGYLVIPEPSTTCLLLFGAAVVVIRRFRAY